MEVQVILLSLGIAVFQVFGNNFLFDKVNFVLLPFHIKGCFNNKVLLSSHKMFDLPCNSDNVTYVLMKSCCTLHNEYIWHIKCSIQYLTKSYFSNVKLFLKLHQTVSHIFITSRKWNWNFSISLKQCFQNIGSPVSCLKREICKICIWKMSNFWVWNNW